MHRLPSTVFTAFLLAGTAVAQDTAPAGDYTDPASGMIYPAAVGTFQRLETGHGHDNGVQAVYRKGAEDLTVTVNVFETSMIAIFLDMPKSRKDMDKGYCMDGIHRVAKDGAQNVVQTDDSDASLKRGWSSKDGFKRSYTLTRDFLDKKQVALHTDIYRFCFIGNRWTVEYRVDFRQVLTRPRTSRPS